MPNEYLTRMVEALRTGEEIFNIPDVAIQEPTEALSIEVLSELDNLIDVGSNLIPRSFITDIEESELQGKRRNEFEKAYNGEIHLSKIPATKITEFTHTITLYEEQIKFLSQLKNEILKNGYTNDVLDFIHMDEVDTTLTSLEIDLNKIDFCLKTYEKKIAKLRKKIVKQTKIQQFHKQAEEIIKVFDADNYYEPKKIYRI